MDTRYLKPRSQRHDRSRARALHAPPSRPSPRRLRPGHGRAGFRRGCRSTSTGADPGYRKVPQTVTQNTRANAALPASRMPTTTLPCQRRSSGSVRCVIGSEAQRRQFEHRAFLYGLMKGERDHRPIALQLDDNGRKHDARAPAVSSARILPVSRRGVGAGAGCSSPVGVLLPPP